jgi:hypothetical protein
MTAPTAIPSFKWAEDAERIFLTIELQSATDVSVQIQTSHFTFSAKAGEPPHTYSLDFELPKNTDAGKSTWSVKGRQVEVVLVKAEADQGYWHSLLKDKNQYKGRVKIDWDLWRDEDEEKALPDDFGGMGMPGMGGMGGMNFGDLGGAGGGEDDDAMDSDDEELPGLVDKETGEKGEGGNKEKEEAQKEDEESQTTKA